MFGVVGILTEAISMKNARGFPAWASRVLSLDEHARLETGSKIIRISKDRHTQNCTKLH